MRSSSSILGNYHSSQASVPTSTFADLLVKPALYTSYIAFEYKAGTEQLDGTTGIVGICYVVSIGTAPKGNVLERDPLAVGRRRTALAPQAFTQSNSAP